MCQGESDNKKEKKLKGHPWQAYLYGKSAQVNLQTVLGGGGLGELPYPGRVKEKEGGFD